ncbi:MAG TPA: TetR/AcrR family transcriptional regulator [Mycobacterium sp.]|nr:TetR/AcrR family transcriptional regulator [Mycobacterium sp.]
MAERKGISARKDGQPASEDRRVRRTHATLQRALIALVEEQDLSQITVADVAERAGVSRSTFYDHYQDVHELAEAACTAMIDDLMASLPNPDEALSEAGHTPESVLRGFFNGFAENANLYRSLLGPNGSARVIDHIRRRAVADLSDDQNVIDHIRRGAVADLSDDQKVTDTGGVPRDLFAAFAAGALLGVAIDWLQRDRPREPADMAALTWPLFAAAYQADGLPPP